MICVHCTENIHKQNTNFFSPESEKKWQSVQELSELRRRVLLILQNKRDEFMCVLYEYAVGKSYATKLFCFQSADEEREREKAHANLTKKGNTKQKRK